MKGVPINIKPPTRFRVFRRMKLRFREVHQGFETSVSIGLGVAWGVRSGLQGFRHSGACRREHVALGVHARGDRTEKEDGGMAARPAGGWVEGPRAGGYPAAACDRSSVGLGGEGVGWVWRGVDTGDAHGRLWFGPLGCAWMLAVPLLALEIGLSVALWYLLAVPFHAAFPRARQRVYWPVRDWVARRMLRDPEHDADMLPTYLVVPAVVGGVFLWHLATHLGLFAREGGASPPEGLAFLARALTYHVVRLGLFFTHPAYFWTLVHAEAHADADIFRGPPRRKVRVLEWGPMAILYGVVPEASFGVGHVKVHHARPTNSVADLHGTREYRRDSPRAFLDMLCKFALAWTGVSVLWHAVAVRRMGHAMVARVAAGMGAYYGTVWALARVAGTRFAAAYLLWPQVEAIMLLGAIAWFQHAFVDPDAPDDELVNSITIVDSTYDVFSADYHAVHHLAPRLPWWKAKAHFEADRATYAAKRATVFRGCQEFECFFLLLQGNLDALVDRMDPPEHVAKGTEHVRLAWQARQREVLDRRLRPFPVLGISWTRGIVPGDAHESTHDA